jgi:osmotically-inducible protein OsmY
MTTSRFWSYFAKVGLGTGVAVALAGAPVAAHAEDNTPSGAINQGSNAAGSAKDKAGNTASGAADQAGNTASGAAQKAGDEASSAANKAGDTASSAADKATATATTAGTPDDSSITDALKTKLAKGDTSDVKVDTDHGVVTLSGTVHQKSTRDHAVKTARKSKGVKSVKDEIEVVPAK